MNKGWRLCCFVIKMFLQFGCRLTGFQFILFYYILRKKLFVCTQEASYKGHQNSYSTHVHQMLDLPLSIQTRSVRETTATQNNTRCNLASAFHNIVISVFLAKYWPFSFYLLICPCHRFIICDRPINSKLSMHLITFFQSEEYCIFYTCLIDIIRNDAGELRVHFQSQIYEKYVKALI